MPATARSRSPNKQLSPQALAVLATRTQVHEIHDGKFKALGNFALTIDGQLDRPLYVEVNGALEALGGDWNRHAKGHLFKDDPRDALEEVAVAGGYLDRRKAFDLFETPDGLADDTVAHAHEHLVRRETPGYPTRVLEPSAGRGALVRAVLRVNPKASMTCVELDETHVPLLRDLTPRVHVADFMSWVPPELPCFFDVIAMNPPFSKGQDIRHVTRAFERFLAPAGLLVAIMSAGVTFRQTREAEAFRALVRAHGEIHANPDGAFAESGTNVRTITVVLRSAR